MSRVSRGWKAILSVAAAVTALATVPASAWAEEGLSPDSGPAVHYDTSPPLSTLSGSPTSGPAFPAQPTRPLPSATSGANAPDTSGAKSATLAEPLMPSTSVNFDGVSEGCSCYPPDPNGAAGKTQYMETTNLKLGIFSKTGTKEEEKYTNALWEGFNGGKELCKKYNRGDATVSWDPLAERWVVQQFAFPVNAEGLPIAPYADCIAVSENSNAREKWHRAEFEFEKFPDYPKLGVWPDGYYISYNLFNTNWTNAGAEVCAINRTAMLEGKEPTQQCKKETGSAETLLPASMEGATAPPSGTPEWFVALSTQVNALSYWKFHVDWSNPTNTTFIGPTNLAVSAFSQACEGGTCIPQLETETRERLDSLGDRLMYRLAYRNFGAHQSMVVTHAVSSEGAVGMRWYELRPTESGSLSVYQQGTYGPPDGTYRWMGSIAMDKRGDMALGYSASSGSLRPQIRYTGRLASDSLGTMPQGEATLYAGEASQEGFRWGDYTSMSVDPTDECTFWYVNEYHKTFGWNNWHTRIGAFKFPSCGGPTVTTGSATGVTATAATLHGTINPNGFETKYYFEYGYTTSYGTKTAEASAGSGTSNVEVSKTITGLTPSTNYHFRIVATNSNGMTDGSDESFTTSTPAWTAQEPPLLTGKTAGALRGISCALSTSCTAVGSWEGVPTAESWNGTAWSVRELPTVSGTHANNVLDVSCTVSPSCKVVGWLLTASGAYAPLAESWNGGTWSAQELPLPSGSTYAFLESVSCTSSSFCTAVGHFENSSGVEMPLAARWNGTTWSDQEPPTLTGALESYLYSVSCTSTTRCTAVGKVRPSSGHVRPLAESWNGTTWSVQELPTPPSALESILKGVSCTSSTSCRASGYFYNGSKEADQPLAESWNGTTWAVQEPPIPVGAIRSFLEDVSCTSSVACMATGYFRNSSSVNVPLAESWNGTTWAVQEPPSASGALESNLRGVSCVSSAECMATGYFESSAKVDKPLAGWYH